MEDRHTLGRGPAVYLGDIGIADLAEGGRGWDREPTLMMEELADPADSLQLWHVGLQEDPVHRTTRESDVITQ
jgi:hypothetical protein